MTENSRNEKNLESPGFFLEEDRREEEEKTSRPP
jgi:hypothetical protein